MRNPASSFACTEALTRATQSTNGRRTRGSGPRSAFARSAFARSELASRSGCALSVCMRVSLVAAQDVRRVPDSAQSMLFGGPSPSSDAADLRLRLAPEVDARGPAFGGGGIVKA